jgi:addiction module HigA family antidote
MATKQTPIRFAVSPGQIIRAELEARGWSQEKLASEMKRPYQAINAIVNGHKAIMADTAIELGDAFGMSAVYWMNLEAAYQLYKAHQKRKAIAAAKPVVARKAASGRTIAQKPHSGLSQGAQKKAHR